MANVYFCTFADERLAGLRVRDRGQHIMHLADTVTCLSLLYFSDLALLYFCVFLYFSPPDRCTWLTLSPQKFLLDPHIGNDALAGTVT